MTLNRSIIPFASLFTALLLISGCRTIMPYKTGIKDESPVQEAVVQINKAPDTGIIADQMEESSPVEEQDHIVIPESKEKEPASVKRAGNKNNNAQDLLSDQELIDSALEYYQTSNEFWDKGDEQNAISALDKANSQLLRINGGSTPEIHQQKDDLRYAVSKRIIDVYDSGATALNGSHTAIPLVMNKHVQKEIDLFTGPLKKWFLETYARSGRYRPFILNELKKARLPEELSWLPFIESGFEPGVQSRARALGMWQFMASTGTRYGLTRDTWVDERMNPEKATVAAIGYLEKLHQDFGDWTTVLAAYNFGPTRIIRYIDSQEVRHLDSFWDIYNTLKRETARYVPKFFAVLHILNNPESYGIELPPVDAPLEYDSVTINKQVLLKSLADGLDMEYSEIKELNSELRRDMTPDAAYKLKVPKGKSEIFLAKINSIQEYRPVYITHRIRSGESLSGIADRYNTSIKAIINMNGLRNRHMIVAGKELKIPTGGSAQAAPDQAKDEVKTREYIVQKGDSLWNIAKRYNTTVNSIKTINNMTSNNLSIGQSIKLFTNTTETKSGDTRNYRVEKGDSPYVIAKKHNMNLYDFLELNNLTPKSTIYPKQIVKVIVR